MAKFKEVEKFAEKMNEYRKKCVCCGHSLIITPSNPKRLCRWCGTMNYLDDKIEFKEKLKNALKK